MVITVVTETYWPEVNGVAMTLYRLVSGLSKRGHKIQLICPRHHERNSPQLSPSILYQPVMGLPIPGYKEAKFGFPSVKILKNLWLKVRPDVIYVATEGPLGWYAIKEANRLGIPVISGFHTNFHSYSRHYKLGFLEKLVERYLVAIHNKTQTTVVPTREQKSMLEDMGVHHIAVMGRGVNTSLFSPTKRDPALRKRWGVENNEPVMIYVGRIAEEKNLDVTLRTYYALHELNPRLKFVLVGDGPLAGKLKKEHPQFIFAGIRTGEDLAAHYASGDIFVFTSLTETFGNVILEAMASGLGVVAYDYAAAGLHIHSGENGLLAKFNDAEDFINKAKRLVQNDVLLKKLRTSARTDAQRNSWRAIVEQFENILCLHTHDYRSVWKQEFKERQQSS